MGSSLLGVVLSGNTECFALVGSKLCVRRFQIKDLNPGRLSTPKLASVSLGEYREKKGSFSFVA